MSSQNNSVFVDIHVIQSLPPSCVNRDDTGSPKTAIYGGVRRARVSSQSWKRAMREMFKESFDENDLGKRTRLCVDWVAEKIISLENSLDIETAREYARDTINIASEKANKPIISKAKKAKKGEEESDDSNDDSKVLLFLAPAQVEKIAELALDWIQTGKKPDKDTVSQNLAYGCTVDIALFGRMVATAPALNTDASAQVAHAISTHKVENEYDYYTAMDDRSPEDQPGASMIGTVEFNSSTLYRYATVAAHDLNKSLGDIDATTKAVKEFVRAFVYSMPTGKQNTFANNTLPYVTVVVLSPTQPVNLVGAFETPIKEGNGYLKASAVKLAEHLKNIDEKYDEYLPQKEGFQESARNPRKMVFVMALDDDIANDFTKDKNLKLSVLLKKIEEGVSGLLKKDEVQV